MDVCPLTSRTPGRESFSVFGLCTIKPRSAADGSGDLLATQYLAPLVHLLRAVNALALAHSLDRDAGWIAAKRGGYGDTAGGTIRAAASSREVCALVGRRCSRARTIDRA
jgi:hypothetical protein